MHIFSLQDYALTRRWHKAFIGGNGKICWTIELTNLKFDPVKDRGYKNPFEISDYSFRNYKQSLLAYYECIALEYDALEKELNELPNRE